MEKDGQIPCLWTLSPYQCSNAEECMGVTLNNFTHKSCLCVERVPLEVVLALELMSVRLVHNQAVLITLEIVRRHL